MLHGDKVAETRLTDLLMPAALQGARDLNHDLDMESAYEYGSRVGFWRLMRIFAERQVNPTIYAVGVALERNPQAAETIARQGCDIVDHGWRWLDYQSRRHRPAYTGTDRRRHFRNPATVIVTHCLPSARAK